ncbi:PP2C family protein-serine/threonine phosphatase [Trueperella bialowiezensis]|uniref:PP2C family protein-serine/threonine phosphatase n=1 Tax=Trueperella bialowiezensis TaxID=312285 RepID=UPI0013E01728|nr:protein phosphatase 2C domain-containing protein [Trueperella bialowiezensis]
MNTLTARAAALSHTGLVRRRNEDRVFTSQRLLAVADGMGGHTLGDVAAQYAIDGLAAIAGELDVIGDLGEREQAVQRALTEVADKICRHLEGRGSGNTVTRILNFSRAAGTTLSALHLGATPLVFHVGDSRAYRYRAGQLLRVTHDHSLVQEMLDAGEITPEEAHNHPRRNIITRAIGTYGPPAVEFTAVDLVPGDVVLLCSDGLSDELDDAEILRLMNADFLGNDAEAHVSVEDLAEHLVEAALDAGGHDNISVVVAEINA